MNEFDSGFDLFFVLFFIVTALIIGTIIFMEVKSIKQYSYNNKQPRYNLIEKNRS